MKKVLLGFLALFLVFSASVTVSFGAKTPTPTPTPVDPDQIGVESGQTEIVEVVTVTPDPEATIYNEGQPQDTTTSAQAEYALPYPGILPDNPLYFFKVARDRLVSFLISDPVKKAEFSILTSDKRINSASMLVSKGKSELALTTLSKSNNYMDEAIVAANKAKASGQNMDSMYHNIKNSIDKHISVVDAMIKKVDRKYTSHFSGERKRLENLRKIADKSFLK